MVHAAMTSHDIRYIWEVPVGWQLGAALFCKIGPIAGHIPF